eukprot:10347447-Ditylum_brightwellii.AAC.1
MEMLSVMALVVWPQNTMWRAKLRIPRVMVGRGNPSVSAYMLQLSCRHACCSFARLCASVYQMARRSTMSRIFAIWVSLRIYPIDHTSVASFLEVGIVDW